MCTYYEEIENAILYFGDTFKELPLDVQQNLLNLKKADDPEEYALYAEAELISIINDDLAEEWSNQNCYETREEMLNDYGVSDNDFMCEGEAHYV